MFLHLSVILFGWGRVSQHAMGHTHPLDRHPGPGQTPRPWTDTPALYRHPGPGQTPRPWTDTPRQTPAPGETPRPWTDTPRQTPRPSTDTPPLDRHPAPGQTPRPWADPPPDTTGYGPDMVGSAPNSGVDGPYPIWKILISATVTLLSVADPRVGRMNRDAPPAGDYCVTIIKHSIPLEQWLLRNDHRGPWVANSVADLRGAPGTRPLESKSFHFHAVSGKKLQNNRLTQPLWDLAPLPAGKFWICHCNLLT